MRLREMGCGGGISPAKISAISANGRHVFVALEKPGSNWERAESVRRIDATTGTDSTPAKIPQPFLPDALIWVNELDALCVLQHRELWIYAPDLLSTQARIPYPGRPGFVSHAENHLLLAERSGTCTLVNLTTASSAHLHGSRNKDKKRSFAIDTPFLSHAFAHGDGRLIRVVDNSWATGRIYFHADPKAEPRVIDSGNAHAVAAIHWDTQRLAISGTGKDLVLFSTTGERLVEVNQAAEARVYQLEFSPAGTKIAAFNADGTVRTFHVR